MKSIVFTALLGLLLVQVAVSQCKTGYYNDTTINKCRQCNFAFSQCGATLADYVLHPNIKGVLKVNNAFTAFCGSAFYNPTNTYC